uniref:Predicted protein n=1 Tax=Hordeum vulgare subsp. vulgare TaxID=112509 RepID=F2DUT9_HORVV|nr:predicted protein [Hordeum vulgare subsp. vulgare]
MMWLLSLHPSRYKKAIAHNTSHYWNYCFARCGESIKSSSTSSSNPSSCCSSTTKERVYRVSMGEIYIPSCESRNDLRARLQSYEDIIKKIFDRCSRLTDVVVWMACSEPFLIFYYYTSHQEDLWWVS